MIKSSRGFIATLFVALSLVMVGCGPMDEAEEENTELSGNKLASGISTEHPITGVSKTACSFTRDQVNQMKNRGYVYAAVPPHLFQGGKTCGRVLTVTVGGACYNNHSASCKSGGGHASVAQFQKASGQKAPSRTIHLYVADVCASCVNSKSSPHIDIGDQAFRGGKLQAIRQYFERNLQKVKQPGTAKTGQPNNLFLSNIVLQYKCAPGLKFENWVTKGSCNK